jgi:hypothetical protein
MTTAPHQLRWRRVVAVGAGSVLLHYMALRAPSGPPPPTAQASPVIIAQLHAPPVAEPAPEPRAAVPLPQVQLRSSPAPARPQYRASPPPPATLTYDVARTDAGGAQTQGETVLDWRTGNGQYRLTAATVVEGSALLALASEGRLGAAGIVPRSMSAQRHGKAPTATHFDAQGGGITFSASEQRVAMVKGTQDKATWPLQLAAIARANPRQLAAGLDLPVGEERNAGLWHFALEGREAIDTAMGRLATWHLAYQPAPGSYRTRLDVWLASEHGYYPVQMRSTEANGTITTQTIRTIVANEAGI